MMLTRVPIFILSAFQTSLGSYSRAPIAQLTFKKRIERVIKIFLFEP